ncbi:MAG: peptide ABC transporter substrate-binding protein [Phycisphaerales bacterium]|nr:MAG: peptide ABC transporter substrate-binding protein [Phycisphaerales bacterium]
MVRLLIPIVLLALAIAVSVLSDRPEPPADFAFINRGDVTTLDLQKMSWMQDLRVGRMLFEGLVRADIFSDDFAAIPAVAERWAISEDGRTYTFFFRENPRPKWSNGSLVKPSDFAYSWRRAMLPDNAAAYFKLFMLIDGAEDFYNWRTDELARFGTPESPYDSAEALWAETERRFESMVAIEADDEARTFTVHLTRRIPYFLDIAGFAVLYPVYPPLVQQYERLDPASGRMRTRLGWTKPPTLVSNGPFKLTRWRFKRDMRFEANPHWWDTDALRIRSVSIPSVEDPNAQVLAFQTGAVDWLSEVTPAYRGDMLDDKADFYREHADLIEELRAQGLDQFEIDRRLPPDPRKHIHAVPAFGTYWWNFNTLPNLPDGRDNPFHDARVRRAFAMMIDKASIADEVRRLGEPVAHSLIPPGSIPGYTPPQGLPNIGDMRTEEARRELIQRARRLLAEAGYPDTSRFPTVELSVNTGGGHDTIAQAIAKNWRQYLGVPVSLSQKEIKVYRDDLKNQNFMTARGGWYGDYSDPTTFLDLNRTGDGNNDRAYSNPVLDELLDRASDEADPEARMRMLEEAERILMEEDVPMAPIFFYSTIYMFDPDRVGGVSAHPRSEQQIHLMHLINGTTPTPAPSDVVR